MWNINDFVHAPPGSVAHFPIHVSSSFLALIKLLQILGKVMGKLESDRKCKQNFIKVTLSGLVHTDDRLALLAIARQLDVEKALGDRITVSVCVCVCVCVGVHVFKIMYTPHSTFMCESDCLFLCPGK